MLLRKLSSHFDSYNYCHKIIKVSFGKHNVGRCILSQSKGFGPKNFPGGAATHIICSRHAAAKYSRNSPNRALQVSVSSKGPSSTSCPGARSRSWRPCPDMKFTLDKSKKKSEENIKSLKFIPIGVFCLFWPCEPL